jgi:uncharacterized protein YcaQ
MAVERATRDPGAENIVPPAASYMRAETVVESHGDAHSRRMSLKEEVSPSEARRIALTAQGFSGLRRAADVGAATLPNAIRRLGLLQIDSVNVLVRAHDLPLFSRLGANDRAALDALAAAKSKRFFEYWGHEASLLPVELHPLLRWRMARAERGVGTWGQLRVYAGSRPYRKDNHLRGMHDRLEANSSTRLN